MAKAGTAAARKPEKAGGRSLVWLQGLLCGLLAACSPGSAVLVGALLAPAIGALLFDRAPGRPTARAMLLCGLSATVYPAMALWNAGNGVETALVLATDSRTAGIAWAACGGGWLLAQVLPIAMRLAIDSVSLARQARLRAMRNRCAAEWGFDNLSEPP